MLQMKHEHELLKMEIENLRERGELVEPLMKTAYGEHELRKLEIKGLREQEKVKLNCECDCKKFKSEICEIQKKKENEIKKLSKEKEREIERCLLMGLKLNKLDHELKLKELENQSNNFDPYMIPPFYNQPQIPFQQMYPNQQINQPQIPFQQMNANHQINQPQKISINNENKNIESKVIEELPKLNINNKEDIMKIIYTQNIFEGFWEENDMTKIIKDKYLKEYNLLKELKDKKINDKVAMTIIIIYFVIKEHPELTNELSMIIEKAKSFINKALDTSYDNIIKEIGLN
jgi:hypothetical protein